MSLACQQALGCTARIFIPSQKYSYYDYDNTHPLLSSFRCVSRQARDLALEVPLFWEERKRTARAHWKTYSTLVRALCPEAQITNPNTPNDLAELHREVNFRFRPFFAALKTEASQLHCNFHFRELSTLAARPVDHAILRFQHGNLNLDQFERNCRILRRRPSAAHFRLSVTIRQRNPDILCTPLLAYLSIDSRNTLSHTCHQLNATLHTLRDTIEDINYFREFYRNTHSYPICGVVRPFALADSSSEGTSTAESSESEVAESDPEL